MCVCVCVCVWCAGPNFLERVGTERVVAARARVAREITSIFATTYSGEVSLREALTVSALHKYEAIRCTPVPILWLCVGRHCCCAQRVASSAHADLVQELPGVL
eukprot:COSAG05_NODE_210_length_14015_cov_3.851785_3_plen_104_part_00